MVMFGGLDQSLLFTYSMIKKKKCLLLIFFKKIMVYCLSLFIAQPSQQCLLRTLRNFLNTL